MKIVMELTDGKTIEGFFADSLPEADRTKEISLAFCTGEIYSGYLSDVDEERIHLTKPGVLFGVSLPVDALVAWFYKEN